MVSLLRLCLWVISYGAGCYPPPVGVGTTELMHCARAEVCCISSANFIRIVARGINGGLMRYLDELPYLWDRLVIRGEV